MHHGGWLDDTSGFFPFPVSPNTYQYSGMSLHTSIPCMSQISYPDLNPLSQVGTKLRCLKYGLSYRASLSIPVIKRTLGESVQTLSQHTISSFSNYLEIISSRCTLLLSSNIKGLAIRWSTCLWGESPEKKIILEQREHLKNILDCPHIGMIIKIINSWYSVVLHQS